MIETKIKNASVKVMLSYDYSHFETSLTIENDEGLALEDVDEARKACQRLSDKAVAQYRKAKDLAAKRKNSEYEKGRFLEAVKTIESKPEGERTINEIAILKQYQDEQWESQFDYEYDYEDDDEDYSF